MNYVFMHYVNTLLGIIIDLFALEEYIPERKTKTKNEIQCACNTKMS